MSDLPETLELETGAAPKAAVIWLHGLGADGHDFEPVVPMLGLPAGLPLRFVFPHAPVRPVTINMGMAMRAWYDILQLGGGGPEDEDGIRSSQLLLDGLIAREAARGIDAARIVLAGFSQGGAVALFTALRAPERDHAAFGAPADCAREMRRCRRARTAGQYELLERRERGVPGFELRIQPRDLLRAHHAVSRDAQLAAHVEQILLHRQQRGAHRLGQRLGEQHADRRIQLIYVAQRLYARRILADARTVTEPGFARVSGSRRDLRQPVSHGAPDVGPRGRFGRVSYVAWIALALGLPRCAGT